MKSLRYVLPALALLLAGAASASADCGYGHGVGNCWFGNLNAYGSSGTLYGSGYLPVPPYFAVHPPVYYSHQYYRPYGWTPFAQPGWMGAATLRPEPVAKVILNPHVAQKAKDEQPRMDHTAQKSEMIHNPYFVKGKTTGQGRLASTKQ